MKFQKPQAKASLVARNQDLLLAFFLTNQLLKYLPNSLKWP